MCWKTICPSSMMWPLSERQHLQRLMNLTLPSVGSPGIFYLKTLISYLTPTLMSHSPMKHLRKLSLWSLRSWTLASALTTAKTVKFSALLTGLGWSATCWWPPFVVFFGLKLSTPNLSFPSHSELKSDPKVNTHTWDTVVARLTQECYDMAQTQMEDLQKVFLSALQAKLADQLAPLPHANCNKIIVTCSGIIYSTIASRIESTMDDTIQTHHASLLHKAYDQAHANVELQYPTIVQDVLTETCNSVLQTEQDQVQATTVEAQNLVQAEFDQWRHDELHTRQAEALARLARWEQDRQEEQLSNFHCTWDMFPLHAICSLSMPFDLHSTPGLLNMASILCQSQPCLRQFPCPSTLTPSHRWT